MAFYNKEEYIAFYKKNNFLVDYQYSSPQKILNDKMLGLKYQRYCKRYEKKLTKEKSDYSQNILEAEKNVLDNDPDFNEFWSVWTTEEKEYIYKKSLMFKNDKGSIQYDPMHVFSRGSCPQLANEELNIIYGPRFFHSLIDQYINPLTGKAMKAEEHEQLWRRVVGNERYNKLLEMKK